MPRAWKERPHERLRTQSGHRGRAREHPDAQAWLGLTRLQWVYVAARRRVRRARVLRVVTGANDIDSSGLLIAAFGLAVPIALAGLGGLWSRARGRRQHRPRGHDDPRHVGRRLPRLPPRPVVRASSAPSSAASSAALVHAVATVTFGVDHIVSGVALNIVALGFAKYLSVRFFSPPARRRPDPVAAAAGAADLHASRAVATALGTLEQTALFFISDLAGILRAFCTNVSRPHDPRRAALRPHVVAAVAHGLRPAAAVRAASPRSPRSRSVSTCCATSSSPCSSPAASPGSAAASSPSSRQRLPRRPDRRPRLHRPRGDDLRQLAPRRAARRVGALRLHRRGPAARRRRRRCTPSCSCSRSLPHRDGASGSSSAAQGRKVQGILAIVVGVARRHVVRPDRHACPPSSPA